jgi:hypothetical protein
MAMKRILLAATALFLLAGCAGNTTFLYKSSAPTIGAQKLPVKVAVLPFKDGTEDFTKRGNELLDQERLMYNLAKAGAGSVITALTPELWAKALADDMASSGDFQSVTFLYSPAEVKDEDFIIEGMVEKANYSGTWARPNEFALSLRALRRVDTVLIWEKKFIREFKSTHPQGCGMSPQCMVDRIHADINGVMQSFFTEARTDLVRTLASLGDRHGQYAPLSAVSPETLPAGETVDREIERILKGN